MTPRSRLVLILLIAAALRLAAFALRAPDALIHAPDEPDFFHIALSVAAGEGFAFEGQPTAFRDTLYPSLMGVLFRITDGWYRSYFLFQLAAELLTIFLLFTIGTKRFGERIGLIIAAAWALFPSAILYSTLFLTESLFVALTVLALFLYDRVESSWLSDSPPSRTTLTSSLQSCLLGLVLGLATLTRSIGLVFLAAFLIYIVLIRYEAPRKIRFQSAAVILVSFAVIVLPWMVRNKIVMGTFALNSNVGINTYIGNNPYATGSYRFDAAVADSLPPVEHGLNASSVEVLRNEVAMSLAAEFWRTHRGEAIDLWARKFAFLWATDLPLWIHYDPGALRHGETSLRDRIRALPLWKFVLVALPYMFIVTCGTAGIFLVKHFDTRGLFILQLALAACAAFLTYGVFRYHFPFMPALIISSAALIRPKPWRSSPQWRRFYLLMFLGLFGGIWTYEFLTIAGL